MVAFKLWAPAFTLTDPAIKSTGLETAEINRQLQGYFQPQEHTRRAGESQEEMLNKTQSMTMLVTSVKPFIEPLSLIEGKRSCVAARFPSSQPWQPVSSGAPHEPNVKSSSLGLGRNKTVMGFPMRAPMLPCPVLKRTGQWLRGEAS